MLDLSLTYKDTFRQPLNKLHINLPSVSKLKKPMESIFVNSMLIKINPTLNTIKRLINTLYFQYVMFLTIVQSHLATVLQIAFLPVFLDELAPIWSHAKLDA